VIWILNTKGAGTAYLVCSTVGIAHYISFCKLWLLQEYLKGCSYHVAVLLWRGWNLWCID
jgi:hypothetical protein